MRELTTVDELNELPIGAVILCGQRAWTRLEPHPSQLMSYPVLVTWGCPDGGFVRQDNTPKFLLPAQLLFTPTPTRTENIMGMFDSLYDQRGTEWQTKAFRCLLDRYEIGDELPGPTIDYQVEILGGDNSKKASYDSYATIRAGSLEVLDAERDPTLPLMDYFGGWRRPNGDEQ